MMVMEVPDLDETFYTFESIHLESVGSKLLILGPKRHSEALKPRPLIKTKNASLMFHYSTKSRFRKMSPELKC